MFELQDRNSPSAIAERSRQSTSDTTSQTTSELAAFLELLGRVLAQVWIVENQSRSASEKTQSQIRV